MRTTVTLDEDVWALLQQLMRNRDLTFKAAINAAIRSALSGPESGETFRTPTFRMGFNPRLPLDRALRVSGELEDEELTRKLTVRK